MEKVRIKEEFSPRATFTSGQLFRVKEEGEVFTLYMGSRIARFTEVGGEVFGEWLKEDRNFWRHALDLDRDYEELRKGWPKDPFMERALRFGRGIRMMNQDPFETTISFILSANSHIPRIQSSLETICRLWGPEMTSPFGRYYGFPSPASLAEVTPQEFRTLAKTGYRDVYLSNTAKRVAKGDFDLEEAFHLTTPELLKDLQTLPGVGPKVAACIALFAYHRLEVYPMDTWMKKVRERYLAKGMDSPEKLFGNTGGLAQQYLFYYARSGRGLED